MSDAQRTHSDGSLCPEGTRKIPRAFTPCCEPFAAHLASCYYDIRFEWLARKRVWIVVIAPQAGGGGIEMLFCPFCGARLAAKHKGAGGSGTRVQRLS